MAMRLGSFSTGMRATSFILNSVNDDLRRKSGLETRPAELSILVTAPEMDSEYVWTTREPMAQEAGLDREIARY